jgi:hypothetical protein
MRRSLRNPGSHRPFLFSLVFFAATAPLVGCAAHLKSAAAEAPKAIVPEVMAASLASLEEPLTRERILAVASTPEMQAMVRDLARSALEGALETALEDPSVDREAARQAVRDLAADATRAAMRAATDEAARSLMPAMRSSVVETLGAPEVREAVSTTVAGATRAAVVSSFDLMKELEEDEEQHQILARLRRMLPGVVT